jgi:hypothetical protein
LKNTKFWQDFVLPTNGTHGTRGENPLKGPNEPFFGYWFKLQNVENLFWESFHTENLF